MAGFTLDPRPPQPAHLARRPRRLATVWAGQPHPRYFVTICTADRSRVLANDACHGRLRSFLIESPIRYGWHPLRYVVMPDHLHLLAVTTERTPIGGWIKAMKAFVAGHTFRWQAGFFDHVLRSEESESAKWAYVLQNPVRAGLVGTPKDLPFAGELRFEATPPGEADRPVG